MRVVQPSGEEEEERLVTVRPVARGELLAFYSGLVVHRDFVLSPLNRTLSSMTDEDMLWVKK